MVTPGALRSGALTDSPAPRRASAPVPSPSRLGVAVGTVVAFVGTFLFRFLTAEFTNDHFQHLARGRQILLGDLPIRDFFDPGLIFQYYASALALAWSGQNLYGEALLTVAFIAAGSALTYLVAAQLSRSCWMAAAAALLVVLSAPRLYNYPKVFFYVAALAAAWRYAQRHTYTSLAMVAAVTVLAFLFRHDHGVYIGLSTLALLATLHWGEPRRVAAAVLQYSAMCLVLLLPFLLYVQTSVGIVRYITGIAPQIQHVSTARVNALPFRLDRSAPLLVIDPAPDRRVNVRWAPGVSAAARRTAPGA
jgi:hypothetical protein